jgi:hypothetical protein
LLRLDRLPEAETHLKKSIQLDPKLGAPQAAMGRLHMDKDNDAEALPYLRTATELDPDNYLTHYYYASLIRKQKDASETDRQSMRRALQRAIELKPEFVEATEMLAGDNLARNVDIPQTVEMLARAMAVAPSRAYLALQLAAALTRTQQREIARPLLHSLIASADLEPPLRQNAQSLLSFLDRAAAAENASRMAAEQSRLLAEQLARNSVPRTAAESENLEPPEIRRNVRDSSTDSPVAAPPPPPGLPDTIAPARREEPLAPGTARVRGMLTLLDCRNGLTLSVMVEGKTVKLHTATPGNIKFTSFNSSVSQSISCGPTSGNGVAATIVYRPRESDGSIGEPLSVDFVEAAGSARSQSVALPEIPGTATVKGLLTLLDCSNGVSVTLLSEGKTLRFYAERNTTIAFLNGPNADGTVTCGPMPGDGVPVVVLYRPSTAAGIQGEPLIVQFQR